MGHGAWGIEEELSLMPPLASHLWHCLPDAQCPMPNALYLKRRINHGLQNSY
ncbi:hypothetical protein [Nostoc commune]|uniref:hypothetical protein n=1 Tax=Nostoc commune TaxID=1178 RepID=UPI0015E7F365|nr:hypothetical protein [Nostoc commune]